MKKPKSNLILGLILVLNVIMSGLSIYNQGILVQNQVATAQHIDTLNDYLATIAHESLETDATEVEFDVSCQVEQFRDGILIGYSEHAGTLTDFGADWIEDQLGDSPSATTIGKYIGVDDDGTAPSTAWTALPSETSGNGMDRLTGTYSSTGVGTYTIVGTFSPTASGSIQLVGLHHTDSGSNLVCADQVTTINYQNGDSIEVTWTITIS